MAKILKRLVRQLRSRGVDEPYRMAAGLLKKYGLMRKGKLTAKGRARDRMTPSERAKDRAAKASGHSRKAYTYNKKTNRARLKK